MLYNLFIIHIVIFVTAQLRPDQNSTAQNSTAQAGYSKMSLQESMGAKFAEVAGILYPVENLLQGYCPVDQGMDVPVECHSSLDTVGKMHANTKECLLH